MGTDEKDVNPYASPAGADPPRIPATGAARPKKGWIRPWAVVAAMCYIYGTAVLCGAVLILSVAVWDSAAVRQGDVSLLLNLIPLCIPLSLLVAIGGVAIYTAWALKSGRWRLAGIAGVLTLLSVPIILVFVFTFAITAFLMG